MQERTDSGDVHLKIYFIKKFPDHVSLVVKKTILVQREKFTYFSPLSIISIQNSLNHYFISKKYMKGGNT
jgi:hypothetical protein